jgi:hypothetical protein
MGMQYFILMLDYGRRGLEAVVHPEQTRSDVVAEVRDILSSSDRKLVHVKFIDGDDCEDITDDIIEAAALSSIVQTLDLEDWGNEDIADYLRDLRKHGEAA